MKPAPQALATPVYAPLDRAQHRRMLRAFVRREHRVQLWAIILGALTLVIVILLTGILLPPSQIAVEPSDWFDWGQRLQVFFVPFTLAVAMFVWFSEVRESWERSLPKLLSVYFFYRGVPVFACRHAYLAGEDDIRQGGQSIGQQMNHGNRLEFVPFLEQSPPELLSAGPDVACKHYRVRFRLTCVPDVAAETGHKDRVARAFLWRGDAEDKAVPVEPADLANEPDVRAWATSLPRTGQAAQIH